MIRVLIQVVGPEGSRSRGAHTIARIDISNETPGGVNVADYTVRCAVEHPNGDAGTHQRIVRGFNRAGWNVLQLVYEALKELGPQARRRSDDGKYDLPPGQ
jgi:hypothetical protein